MKKLETKENVLSEIEKNYKTIKETMAKMELGMQTINRCMVNIAMALAGVESEPLTSVPSPSYPPITSAQERFFEKWRWVVIDKMTGKITEKMTGNLEKNEEKKKVDVKLEELMHSIFDYTHQWGWNPEDTNSVHRWRMLYDLLGQQKFFKEGERKKYRPFVDAVIKYCYPEVRNTYNDNLRQTALPESFHDWAREDWEEYRRLKAIILEL